MPPSARVLETQPGFPGAEYLERGDQIVMVDGVTLPQESTVEEFRNQIMGHRLGQQVTLRVIRGPGEITVRVPLTYGIDPALGNTLPVRLQQRAEEARRWAAEVLDDERVALPVVVIGDETAAGPPL